MGAQKAPMQKTYEINVGQGSLDIDLQEQIDSLTGQNYIWSTIKVTNTLQYMTVTTLKWPQEKKISKAYKLY